jgi:hypothetical protein
MQKVPELETTKQGSDRFIPISFRPNLIIFNLRKICSRSLGPLKFQKKPIGGIAVHQMGKI